MKSRWNREMRVAMTTSKLRDSSRSFSRKEGKEKAMCSQLPQTVSTPALQCADAITPSNYTIPAFLLAA